MRILVVDDDPHILEALTASLELQWPGSEVVAVGDGEEGLRAFRARPPDVVVLDLALPGRNGFDVLREIRSVSRVPIVILTARGDDAAQVRGLELGADDYIVKPFSPLVLLARIRAVLRRAQPDPAAAREEPDFRAGDLAIDFASHEVTVRGVPVKLTPVEYKLLYHLVRNAGRLMTHQALLDVVWGPDYLATTDYLKVFISRLRAKIETPGGPRYIQTERGLGYRFVRPRPARPPAGGRGEGPATP